MYAARRRAPPSRRPSLSRIARSTVLARGVAPRHALCRCAPMNYRALSRGDPMGDPLAAPLHDVEIDTISRRQLLRALSLAAVGAPLATALGQGRCIRRLGLPGCDTTA